MEHENQTAPHDFDPVGPWWRWKTSHLCRHCYGPRSLHPRRGWVKARPLGDRTYISANAPHFEEGW